VLTMYDAVVLSNIPDDAEAVAGYVDGRWPTFQSLSSRWPHAHRLSIATSPASRADALDVEQGDARLEEVPDWVLANSTAGRPRPVLYASVSAMQAVVDELLGAGIPRNHFRLWTAHYTGTPHLCGPRCGLGFRDSAGATQYTDRALGRSLDASLVGGVNWFGRERG
jgi:hypothetical protein